MKLMIWVGLLVFLAGMVILGVYSMYPLFNTAVEDYTVLFGIKVSMALMGIGAAILILAICFERYKEWKRFKDEIKEDDLRP